MPKAEPLISPDEVQGIANGIGRLEASVLRVLADLPQAATARQVCDALGRKGYFDYQGTLACLNRLATKGILECDRTGRAYTYRLRVDLEALTAQVVTNVMAHFGGDRDRICSRVLGLDPDRAAPLLADLRHRAPAKATKRRKPQAGS